MKKAIVIKIIVGAVLLPLSSLFLISKFNIFSYLNFIPIDYRYEAGLGCYIAVLDALYEYITYRISKKKTKITFVFYKVLNEMKIGNVPTIVLSERNNGVATFHCNIRLEGNLKRLRKMKIYLPLPNWITSQVPQSDEIRTSVPDGIVWDFSNILPSISEYEQNIECKSSISLIKTQSENELSITVKPQLKKSHFWDSFGIEFNANEVIIQNKE